MSEKRPKSWAELLQQREAERNRPPPKEFYIRQKVVSHPDGGVIAISAPETRPLEESSDKMDSHLYATTAIFDPEEEVERHVRPRRDHGLDIMSWGKKSKYQREKEDLEEFKKRSTNYPKAQMESEDYDIISNVPHQTPYKVTIQNLLKQREISARVEKNRTFDPISNTYPSKYLESQKTQSEVTMRKNVIDHYQNKMPENERRAKNTLVNIVTGETKDENAAKAVNDFPTSDIRRCVTGKKREKEIVENRENEVRAHTAKVGCRYNNGRMKEVRNWNIINGDPAKVAWDESVKMKPSIWTWCQAEKLVV